MKPHSLRDQPEKIRSKEMARDRNEPRSKDPALLSIESWLVNRDPCFMVYCNFLGAGRRQKGLRPPQIHMENLRIAASKPLSFP